MSPVHPLFEAIIRAHAAAVKGKTCMFCCERPATTVDVFMDAICDECALLERAAMKQAEAEAEQTYFSGESK